MAYQIATEAYAQSKGGVNVSYTPNLGCTKSRAIALGCKVLGNYTDNQLVCQKDLGKTSTVTYSLKNDTSDYLTNVRIYAGNCIFSGNLPAGRALYTTAAPNSSSWTITINGSTSTSYIVYPTPNSTIRSYTLSKKDYSYNISITPSSTVSGNQTRVFLLSNMDPSLVGTKNYISVRGITSNYTIYTKTNSPGSIGSFIGNQCTNQLGPITMVDGNTYSILYTVIDTSSNTDSFPAGTIITNWKRIHQFVFHSDAYYYSFYIPIELVASFFPIDYYFFSYYHFLYCY